MAFDSKKTILLEKTYLYVRASLGFQLEGTSTEKIPTNNGFYRFFVDNLQKAIGNSYVNILYDSQDLTLQCFCSDLYMDELMSSDSSAIEDVVEELKKNTTTIIEFESGVSSGLESNHLDNVALNNLFTDYYHKNFFVGSFNSFISSRSGDLSFGVAPSNVRYLLDVDKFNLFYNYWRCSENINIRGARIFETFLDTVFDYPSFSQNCFIYEVSQDSNYKSLVQTNDTIRFKKSGSDYSTYRNLDYLGIVLCTDLSFLGDEFGKLVFSSHSKKFSKFSYSTSDSNPSLYFYRVEECTSCCINQIVDVPFTGDYLNFSFDSKIDIKLLKGLTYHFVTDVMDVSYTGEQLGLHYLTSLPYKVVCGPFPNLHPEGSDVPSRLLRVYVSK